MVSLNEYSGRDPKQVRLNLVKGILDLYFGTMKVLGYKDSNLDFRFQRPTYCHYTMPQKDHLVFIIIPGQSSNLIEISGWIN